MRYTLQVFVTLSFLLILAGCSEHGSKTETNFAIKPLLIPGDNGDDWGDGDLAISIVNITDTGSGKLYKAISSYKNENLGLYIFVPDSKEGDKGFGNGITLKSIGRESDRLLSILATLYKQKLMANSKFVKSISLDYVDLGEFAKSIGGDVPNKQPGTMEYKLFFKGKDDEAELYLNIKSDEHIVEIREKDEEYRPKIIQFLAAHSQ